MGSYQIIEYFRMLNLLEQLYTFFSISVILFVSTLPWVLSFIAIWCAFLLVYVGKLYKLLPRAKK